MFGIRWVARTVGRSTGPTRRFSSDGTVPPAKRTSWLGIFAAAGAGGALGLYLTRGEKPTGAECPICAIGWRNFVQPVLMQLDPERAHRLAIWSAKHGFAPFLAGEDPPELRTEVWGKSFPNPVGLAAGFDKHAEAVDGLLKMGFGFVEIGSVTPLPQPGNAKPRVFRLMEDRAVINRYGFNSEGHEAVRDRLIARGNASGIVGVNVGQNKDSPDASKDYVAGVTTLGPLADYIVVNVSCPNMAGVRGLQGKQQLEGLLQGVLAARGPKGPPLLVKISPDLSRSEMAELAKVVQAAGVDGLIVSNTTTARPPTLQSKNKSELGGLSGAPLCNQSTEAIRTMYKLTEGKLPIIGVGGISSGRDAYDKICAGASLVQIYSALVFAGPHLIPRVKRELVELLRQDNFTSVAQAVGSRARTGAKVGE